MASFFSNILKPYEKNKLVIHEYISGDHYVKNVAAIEPRIVKSLTAIAHNEITMQFTSNVYVFSENELKELLQNR